MNEYQLIEAGNMQKDEDPLSMPLTPRIQLRNQGSVYMNISDLTASLEFGKAPDHQVVYARSRLVEKEQKDPPGGPIHCLLTYTFREDEVTIQFHYDAPGYEGQVEIIFPVIASSEASAEYRDNKNLRITRANSTTDISCDQGFLSLPATSRDRLFNFVPGLEAIPLLVKQNDAVIRVRVQ
jgi:hypothetical protein